MTNKPMPKYGLKLREHPISTVIWKLDCEVEQRMLKWQHDWQDHGTLQELKGIAIMCLVMVPGSLIYLAHILVG